MKKILFALFAFLLVAPVSAKTPIEEIPLPKNIVIIQQSSSGGGPGYTEISAVIPETGELILIVHCHSDDYIKCYKTGARIDLSKQNTVSGKK